MSLGISAVGGVAIAQSEEHGISNSSTGSLVFSTPVALRKRVVVVPNDFVDAHNAIVKENSALKRKFEDLDLESIIAVVKSDDHYVEAALHSNAAVILRIRELFLKKLQILSKTDGEMVSTFVVAMTTRIKDNTPPEIKEYRLLWLSFLKCSYSFCTSFRGPRKTSNPSVCILQDVFQHSSVALGYAKQVTELLARHIYRFMFGNILEFSFKSSHQHVETIPLPTIKSIYKDIKDKQNSRQGSESKTLVSLKQKFEAERLLKQEMLDVRNESSPDVVYVLPEFSIPSPPPHQFGKGKSRTLNEHIFATVTTRCEFNGITKKVTKNGVTTKTKTVKIPLQARSIDPHSVVAAATTLIKSSTKKVPVTKSTSAKAVVSKEPRHLQHLNVISAAEAAKYQYEKRQREEAAALAAKSQRMAAEEYSRRPSLNKFYEDNAAIGSHVSSEDEDEEQDEEEQGEEGLEYGSGDDSSEDQDDIDVDEDVAVPFELVARSTGKIYK